MRWARDPLPRRPRLDGLFAARRHRIGGSSLQTVDTTHIASQRRVMAIGVTSRRRRPWPSGCRRPDSTGAVEGPGGVGVGQTQAADVDLASLCIAVSN